MLDKKMFFTSGDESGCGHYRTRLPAEFLGYEWNYGFPVNDKRLDDAEIIVLQRATHEYFLEWIPKVQSEGKRIIYDIDDNLWEIPSSNAASSAYGTKELKQTKSIMQLCNAVIVSTDPLKKYFDDNKFNNNIHIIPNFINDIYPNREHGDIITVGYCGTVTHKGDFDYRLVNALRKLKGKCRLVFVGYNPIPGLEDLHIAWIKPEDYLDEIYKLNIDILVAPLYDNMFNKCKSNLKFLEMAAMNTCVVASNVYPYANTIIDGETGIIIEKDKEWEPILNKLVDNKFWRQNMADKAHHFVKKNYTYKHNGQVIINKYKDVLNSL